MRFLLLFCSDPLLTGDWTFLINCLTSWFLSIYLYSIFLSDFVSPPRRVTSSATDESEMWLFSSGSSLFSFQTITSSLNG
jgi:hypothetical protein